MKVKIFLSILFILFLSSVNAQSLPVEEGGLDDYYRRAELLGTTDSSISFTIRPLYQGKDYLTFDSIMRPEKEKVFFKILPLDWKMRYNSHHPFGWNDGPLIPAKGLQGMISGGVYAQYGPLSVQFKPEVITAQNPGYRGFPTDVNEVLWWTLYYDFYNYTDLPERFGSNSYTRAYWGQSSVRLTFEPVSIGLSTENLWWGPGIRNSLLMSNTAPGFKHFSVNTSKPVKTSIGSFESQIVIGRLEGSGYGPMEPNPIYFGNPIYLPKPADWRYFSGLALTWQPKWVPGLFLGLNQSSQTYSKDLNKFGDYLPFFFPFKRIKTDDPINTTEKLSSVFFRWVWPEEQAEIYFEYGRNDPSGNLRDFVTEPENSRAYIFGLRKLLPFGKRAGEHIQIGLEVTQLQQTSPEAVRNAESWYVNKHIRHGYTNRGEPLGAGIGPGANSQSVDISWVKGLKKIGLRLERYIHNNDYYYYAFEPTLDWRRHWLDINIGANSEWDYKNFVFSAQIQAVKSHNYKWYFKQGPYYTYNGGIDAFNIQAQMGVSYKF